MPLDDSYMQGDELQEETGEGQIEIGGWSLACSYQVTFRHEGRKRLYQDMSGTSLKANREWQKLRRHGLNLALFDGWPAELHLSDGKKAGGYLRVKDFSVGAPGRSVFRFALLTQGPSKPAA